MTYHLSIPISMDFGTYYSPTEGHGSDFAAENTVSLVQAKEQNLSELNI
jgi:hypothetical protein